MVHGPAGAHRPLLSLICCALLLSLIPAGGSGGDASRGDGNDSFDTAVEAKSDVQVLGALDATTDPADFFWISADVGQVVDAHNINRGYNFSDPDEVDFDLEIYGPLDHEEPLASSRTRDQFEIDNVLVAVKGRYYVKLMAVNGSGEYSFTVRVYEPETMVDGGVYKGYLKSNSHNDTWWYKIYLKGGNPAEAVKVTMTHDATGNLDLFLEDLWSYRPFYVNLSWWMGPPNEVVRGVASYTGNYYVKVEAWSGWGNYNLKVEVSEVATDNDNSKDTARFLEYNTTWTDRVDMADDKYDIFEVRMQPKETISIDLALLETWDDIYSVLIVDVDMELIIERTNYIFEPVHDTDDGIRFSKEVDGGVYYVMVMAKVALTEDPDDLSDETAASDYRIIINMSKHPERPTNRAPSVRSGQENMTIGIDEDVSWAGNLNDVFMDPDGDKLVFTAISSLAELTVSVDLSGTVTLVPRPNWYGTGAINFTAEDPGGLSAWLVVGVNVRSMPEPPMVTDYGPSRTETMAEGEAVMFYVKVKDDDSPAVFFNWSIDGVDQKRKVSNLTYTPDYVSAGPHIIEVRITDGMNQVVWDWDVFVNDTNRLPVIVMLRPENGTRYGHGKKVNLAAVIEDPDGDSFSFEWREGLTVISHGEGTQPDINHTFPSGKHTVKLTVIDDRGGMVVRYMDFVVEEEEGGLNWGWLAAGTLVAIVVAFIIFAYAAPRRRVDEEDIEKAIEEELEEEERVRGADGDVKERKGRKRGGRKGRRRAGTRAKKGKRKVTKKDDDEELDEGMEDDIAREVREERRRMERKRRKKEA